ncbi:MAG: hypothetical protein IPN17_03180 [Deltaproteobacteria bacterium]|nr:hypothetical protein [Deltaproteobacteria bacterium]
MGVLAASTTLSSVAAAQTGGNMSTGAAVSGSVQVGAGTPPAALPPSRSDNDPAPRVAAPVVPAGGIVSQAGIGGSTAYGRPGVVELGGSIGLTLAGDLSSTSTNGVSTSASSLNVLVEPSYHLPLTQSLFAFLGVGVGLGYADGPGAGFALAPRLGMNIMVGRSGILTPALQFVYSTSQVINTPQGTLIGGNTSFGLNVGYTVML